MNNNPRMPLQGAPNSVELPRMPPYVYRTAAVPVFSPMIASAIPPQSVSSAVGFIPYNPGIIAPHQIRSPFPSPGSGGNVCMPLSIPVAASSNPVDLRSLPPKQPAARPFKEDNPAQKIPHAAQDQPLDLSTKTKPTPPGLPVDNQAPSVLIGPDQPLDLSKPSKPHAISSPQVSSTPVYQYPATSGLAQVSKRLGSTVNQPGAANQLMDPIHTTSSAPSFSSVSHSTENDDRLNCLTPNNMSSVSSLIGNHPIDDILYLHCKRCQSSYGSVHAFRKHFRNVHGHMPSSEDVLIQSIKATKEYVANKNDHNALPNATKYHCNYCGWQCEQSNHPAFTRHLTEHYSEKPPSYKCVYCKQDCNDINRLRTHLTYHTTVYQYICAFCNIAFQYEPSLESHMNTHHRTNYALRRPHIATVAHVSPSYVASTDTAISSSSSPHLSISQSPSLSKPKMASALTIGDQVHSNIVQRLANADSRTMEEQNMRRNPMKLPDIQSRSGGMPYAVSSSPDKPKLEPFSRGLVSNTVSSSPALSSAPTLPANSNISSTNGSQGPGNVGDKQSINLLSLLDKVVEDGLRGPVSPESKTKRQASDSDNVPPYSAVSSVMTHPPSTETNAGNGGTFTSGAASPAGAQKMSGKTIIEHITEAVTRELIANQEPVSTKPSVKSFLDGTYKGSGIGDGKDSVKVNGIHQVTKPAASNSSRVESSPASLNSSNDGCKVDDRGAEESDTKYSSPVTESSQDAGNFECMAGAVKDNVTNNSRGEQDVNQQSVNVDGTSDAHVEGAADKITSSTVTPAPNDTNEDTQISETSSTKQYDARVSHSLSDDSNDSSSPKRLKIVENDS